MSTRNLVIVLVLCLGFITYFNFSVKQRLVTEQESFIQPTKVTTHIPPVVKKKKSKSKKKVEIEYKLTPSNPEDYGFISHDSKARMPKTTEGWEIHYRKVFKENPVFEAEGGDEALNRMKTSSKEYLKNMDTLEEHIVIFEEKKSIAPLDEDIEHMLQNLYRLKALGRVMKERVVIEDSDFVNPILLNYIKSKEDPREE